MRIDVLDHGFVTLRNMAGPTRRVSDLGANWEYRHFDADDTDPANSARMSFDKMDEGRTREADLKLADYLMKNRHTTPFEMIEIWVEMKMPIFVARQFVRHRTVTINEVSGRYVTLPGEWYIPKREHVGYRPENVKQGRVILDINGEVGPATDWFLEELNTQCAQSYLTYCNAIDGGIPPEVARTILHLNHYTHWLWKQDLHNMMHFLALRVDSHAQWEAQQYAQAVLTNIRTFLPNSMELFDKYRRLS